MKNFANVYVSKMRARKNFLARNCGVAGCGAGPARDRDATPPRVLTSPEILRRGTPGTDEIKRRFYSGGGGGGGGPPSTKLPPLMNFPEIVWPSLIKSIRNFILATFIIKPYLDREFNLPDFVLGSKRALEVVSAKISQGDIKNLDGLVTSDVILSLQKSLQYMSVFQREQIAIRSEDIYFSFPYQVGIMFNEQEGQEQKRFVEITMVFHTLRGLASMRERGEEPPLNMGVMPEYQKRISICNYRFIREYTKGKESDWTINLLNHFKPSDHLEE